MAKASVLLRYLNMGQYSVIGITSVCKTDALCGCWFKSNLAHHKMNNIAVNIGGVGQLLKILVR